MRKIAMLVAGALVPLGMISASCESSEDPSGKTDSCVPAPPGVNLDETEAPNASQIGREVGARARLADGQEYELSTKKLIRRGQALFAAVWTPQEGGGRPLTKGVGDPLTDPSSPLIFPRNFNRLSAPDSNSCTSCHNTPFPGGGGHIVANAFLPVHRFDFATLDPNDSTPLRGSRNEKGEQLTLDNLGASRATVGMFGSGYIEMLAREMTVELQAQRDATPVGGSSALSAKGISFGKIARRADGSWDTAGVEGIPPGSLVTAGAAEPPSLVIRPFHQSGTVISVRQFTNNAMNHHHGIQTTERFGVGADPDGDGFVDEMSRAEVTATTLFQVTLPVPGRVIPNDPAIEAAVWTGEQKFDAIGCTSCHASSLPLNDHMFVEPSPFNPAGNLRPGDARSLTVDLTSSDLPAPRLKAEGSVVQVAAYTDLKLHDITSGPDDPNADPVNIGETAGSAEFFSGTRKFLTKKLWGVANEPPYFHHGKFTTLRQAILAHSGEAQKVTDAFKALSQEEQDAIIEFLKSLQVLPAGTTALVVDERGGAKPWPPK